MNYVITDRKGVEVIEVGQTKANSLIKAKNQITRMLAQKGFGPCETLGCNNGKWFHSVSNPHWVLRYKQKRYFQNENEDMVCAYVVPPHYSLSELTHYLKAQFIPETYSEDHNTIEKVMEMNMINIKEMPYEQIMEFLRRYLLDKIRELISGEDIDDIDKDNMIQAVRELCNNKADLVTDVHNIIQRKTK